MTIITLPNAGERWRTSSFGLLRADAINEHIHGGRQVTAYPKALWHGRLELPPLADDDEGRRRWRAVLVQLSKLSNTFELTPPEAQEGPSTGYAGASILVSGGDQLGLSLDVDGADVSTELLRQGDYFEVTAAGVKELKMVMADVSSDGSGEATITFEPALRNAPADNAEIIITAPKTGFSLIDPVAKWENSLEGYSGVSFDFVEAFQ